MELPFSRSLRSRSHKRRGYIRVDATAAATAIATTDDHEDEEGKKMIRAPKRAWRIKVAPKLRFKMGTLSSSPLKLWRKLKNGYVNMMLNLANDGTNVFGQKRIPKARQLPPVSYSPSEFEKRLVFEIYKSLVASRELHGHTLN